MNQKATDLYDEFEIDHQVFLAHFQEQTDYMSVIGKVMMGGAATNIKTVTWDTGQKAEAAMAKANGSSIDYKPSGQ